MRGLGSEGGIRTWGLGRAQEWAESEIGGGGAWANGPKLSSRGDHRALGLWAELAVEKKPNSGRAGEASGRGLRAAGCCPRARASRAGLWAAPSAVGTVSLPGCPRAPRVAVTPVPSRGGSRRVAVRGTRRGASLGESPDKRMANSIASKNFTALSNLHPNMANLKIIGIVIGKTDVKGFPDRKS
ncbi:unnamed protein product [Rangifer tarandus platyrhynchus]|uniref:MEIOB-like N-terminal domain-containing protein n=2 Tax=Rangifer tarandus platyrhynchus TaxID=3082113 RepID=A0ABN8ZK76_RANTA|nr:unnamed protein product [Rangifer tarandus platyrhynchus]CAI9708512.1 unnamed protein product [Rangifer tarandus platyrhynchus]